MAKAREKLAEKPARKGARSFADIDPRVLEELHAGRIETASLVEWLAIDLARLVENVAPEVGLEAVSAELAASARAVAGEGITLRMRVLGAAIHAHGGTARRRASVLRALASHRADTVRGLAAYAIEADLELDLARKLERIRPLAADPHSGVRELAWLAVRPSIARDLGGAIEFLSAWSHDADPNVRRFASESTRPRGVWCAHIAELKARPSLALPILEPLASDPSRYVQNSVANWLNDASKSDPRFVRDVVQRWTRASRSAETAYIAKRALRSV
jgi:3-methyladenine DNA glycosylase AlkC